MAHRYESRLSKGITKDIAENATEGIAEAITEGINEDITEETTKQIWHNIILHQNELLHTAKGLPFTYSIKMLPDGSLGNEIVVSRRSKTITRATVDKAYQKVVELGEVKGPKQLGVFGASYLYVIFKVIGVIKDDGIAGASGADYETDPNFEKML